VCHVWKVLSTHGRSEGKTYLFAAYLTITPVFQGVYIYIYIYIYIYVCISSRVVGVCVNKGFKRKWRVGHGLTRGANTTPREIAN
jgi:hypothetical protein